MTFLVAERETLDCYLPGLDEKLRHAGFDKLETLGGPGARLLRECGGCGLIVPRQSHGRGAPASAAVRIQRAIGSRSPSLAIASTMHHFSVASLMAAHEQTGGLVSLLLEAIATHRQLLASGFAEGRTGSGVFEPTVAARRSPAGVVIDGVKKPCSLSHSMDILTVSARMEPPNSHDPALAVVLVPADAPGVSIEPFWRSGVLMATESDAVVLDQVQVDESLVVPLPSTDGTLDELQATGFLWFELLMTASYVGAASGLVERLLERGAYTAAAESAQELEPPSLALEWIAAQYDAGAAAGDLLPRVLLVRYAAQDEIRRAVSSATEALGGMAFIQSDDIGYLATAIHALAFHPPSRHKAMAPLGEGLAGQSFAIS